MSPRRAPRAAIYVRYSTRDQNPRAQLRAVRELVARRGWELVETYQEAKHYSGRDDRRPELLRMLADAKRRRFDVLAFYSLSRLARSLKLSLFVFEDLATFGVDVVSVTEAIDLTTASGRMMRDMLAVLASFERELIVERTLNGMQEARARGVKFGRPRTKFDLARALELRAEGVSAVEIASQLKVARTTLRRALDEGDAAAGGSPVASPTKKRRRPPVKKNAANRAKGHRLK